MVTCPYPTKTCPRHLGLDPHALPQGAAMFAEPGNGRTDEKPFPWRSQLRNPAGESGFAAATKRQAEAISAFNGDDFVNAFSRFGTESRAAVRALQRIRP